MSQDQSSNLSEVKDETSEKWRPYSRRPESCYSPRSGFISNPYYSGSIRNVPCICGSGKKTKKCHGKDPFIMDPRLSFNMNPFVEKEDGPTV
jgi:hypothetical protein